MSFFPATLDRSILCRRRSSEWLQAMVDHLREAADYGVAELAFTRAGKVGLLKAERNHPRRTLTPRTMLDSWFAYHLGLDGLLKSTLAVQWLNRGDLKHPRIQRLLCELEPSPFFFISSAAHEVLSGERPDDLMKDHAVPVSVLKSELLQLKDISLESVEEHLLRRYRLGIITAEENARFTRHAPTLNLRSSMPPGCDPADNFARYSHPLVNIARHKPGPECLVS